MHVWPVDSIRVSSVAVARAPRLRRVRHLLLATVVGVGILSMAQAAAQEVADPGSAQDAVVAAEQTMPSAQPGRNGKVCEYEEVTGSRMKKRVCYTPEQWEARQRTARELVRELDGKSIAADGNGG